MKYRIEWLERKTTSTGKQMAKVTLRDEQGVNIDGVTIWGDFQGFAQLAPGFDVEGDIVPKGEYKTLYGPRTSSPKTGASNMMEKKTASIAASQERKENAIETSSTFRDATMLTVEWSANQRSLGTPANEGEIKSKWQEFRSFLLANYEVK